MFVDDLSVEQTAPDEMIVDNLGRFIRIVAEDFKEAWFVLSKIKSLCSASTLGLATTLCEN